MALDVREQPPLQLPPFQEILRLFDEDIARGGLPNQMTPTPTPTPAPTSIQINNVIATRSMGTQTENANIITRSTPILPRIDTRGKFSPPLILIFSDG